MGNEAGPVNFDYLLTASDRDLRRDKTIFVHLKLIKSKIHNIHQVTHSSLEIDFLILAKKAPHFPYLVGARSFFFNEGG